MRSKGEFVSKRMCVGCRTMKPKNELVRIVLDVDGAKIDSSGKRMQRGAYVCKSIDCIKLAEKKKAFSRAFKANASLNIYDEIRRMMENE